MVAAQPSRLDRAVVRRGFLLLPEIDNDTLLALPLDVPSDEEIEKKAMNHNRTDNYTTIDYYSTGIIVGSKWVRDEILKRNK